MRTFFDRSFFDQVSLEMNPLMLEKIKDYIEIIEQASNVSEIPAIKKIISFKNYYRIKLSPIYRIGVKIIDHDVYFITYTSKKFLQIK